MIRTSIGALLAVVALHLPAFLSGQQVEISGRIPGGENTELRLMVTDDYISKSQKILQRVTIDSTGGFTIRHDLRETVLITLEVGHYSFSFFAEPEAVYILGCDSLSLQNEKRPFYNKEFLPAYLISEPPPGLNALAGSFNQSYNDFIMKEFGGIYQRRNTTILMDFRNQAQEDYSAYDHDYLNQYISYKLAGVELAMAPAKKPELFNRYLNHQPILLGHPEYMEFFNSFFDHYLFPDNRFIKRSDLYSTINYKPDLSALLDTLGKDTTLKNEVIRELVCMKSLKELYHSNEFSKSAILGLLHEMKSRSKFEKHREIAGNLISGLTFLQKGYPPPDFELPGLDSSMVSLSSLKGKPVYVNFFTSWSSGCIVELGLMKDLYEEYKQKVNFLSISLDNDIQAVRDLKAEKGYDWNFAFNGLDYDLIFEYRIKTFPVFLLLDQDGKVYEFPAYKPSEIIRESIDRLLEGE